jgi:hypothetical protein
MQFFTYSLARFKPVRNKAAAERSGEALACVTGLLGFSMLYGL